jgi:hypothetical protein
VGAGWEAIHELDIPLILKDTFPAQMKDRSDSKLGKMFGKGGPQLSIER